MKEFRSVKQTDGACIPFTLKSAQHSKPLGGDLLLRYATAFHGAAFRKLAGKFPLHRMAAM
jgi:hypothetical protein